MGLWVLERTTSAKYPYKLRILRERRLLFEVLTTTDWPAEGQQVFCIRPERTSVDFSILSVVEEVSVKGLHRRGPILSVVLDRPSRKRCEFLVLPLTITSWNRSGPSPSRPPSARGP